jgi:glucose/mannose-6-phosphate isomerase
VADRPALLDDPAAVARADVHGVRDILGRFPAQCREAVGLLPSAMALGARPRGIVIAGMGGSASGGDLLAACAADHLDVPVLVHRGYGLPGLAGTRDLVIASSYSGDTEETVSAAEAALARGCALVAVTAGGRLAALADGRGRPRVTLPSGLMPRMALGYLLFPLLAVLRAAGVEVVKDGDVDETLGVLDGLAEALGPTRPATRNEAKQLAAALAGRLPAVYGGPLTGAVAYRWKTDIEENAKALAVAGALPEMNHNEVEAWRPPAARGRHLVFLRDAAEPAPIARRFEILHALIGPEAGGVSEVWARGTSRLARLISTAYVGQWVSYYLALLEGVDPWTIPVLDALKARMRAVAP